MVTGAFCVTAGIVVVVVVVVSMVTRSAGGESVVVSPSDMSSRGISKAPLTRCRSTLFFDGSNMTFGSAQFSVFFFGGV